MEQIKCNFNLNVINIWKETPNGSKAMFSTGFFHVIFFLLLVVDYVFSVGKCAKSIGLFSLASWGLCSNVPSTGPVGG